MSDKDDNAEFLVQNPNGTEFTKDENHPEWLNPPPAYGDPRLFVAIHDDGSGIINMWSNFGDIRGQYLLIENALIAIAQAIHDRTGGEGFSDVD